MIVTILLVLAVIVGAVLLIAATRPGAFQITRSTTINVPPERVYPLIEDFRNWGSWSPWEKLDPGMQRTHSGAPRGVGAVYEWQGNKKVGKGRMQITEAVPASRVVLDLQFIEPWAVTNRTTFALSPKGSTTGVVWTMNGEHQFMMKVMCLFVSMDKLVGRDFEAGLSNLKSAAEK